MIDHFLPRGESEETAHELSPQPLRWDAPRILDLNEDTEWEYDRTGVYDTTTQTSLGWPVMTLKNYGGQLDTTGKGDSRKVRDARSR